jgi:hypothetical protein
MYVNLIKILENEVLPWQFDQSCPCLFPYSSACTLSHVISLLSQHTFFTCRLSFGCGPWIAQSWAPKVKAGVWDKRVPMQSHGLDTLNHASRLTMWLVNLSHRFSKFLSSFWSLLGSLFTLDGRCVGCMWKHQSLSCYLWYCMNRSPLSAAL